MHPQIAFILYLVVAGMVMFMFLLLCVRVSVYIEDTCPASFCVRRQQRKMRKKLIRSILYPDEPEGAEYAAPPSEDNITADIICRPYIYRDAYSTGLTGLGRTLESGQPLTESEGSYTSNSVYITNHRIIFRRMIPAHILNQLSPVNNPNTQLELSLTPTHHLQNDTAEIISPRTIEEGAAEAYIDSLPPPAYSNLINLNNSVNIRIEDETGSLPHIRGAHIPPIPLLDDELSDEPPPPSYDECVTFSGRVPLPPPPPTQTGREGS